MAQATLTVPAISCGHCARTITSALTPVAGVREVTVDIPQQQVCVDYDEASVTVDQFVALLAEEDYPVASVEGDLAASADELSAGCVCCQPAAAGE